MKLNFAGIAGCILTACGGGMMLRFAPNNDPVVWLCATLMGVAFACFWAEMNRPQ